MKSMLCGLNCVIGLVRGLAVAGGMCAGVGLCASQASAQGTTFTYQGELVNSGQPANGVYDMRFSIFGTVTGATQIGTTFCVDNVTVTDGRFTVEVNAGTGVFTGLTRYLEVQVRGDTGQNCASAAGFTILGPRQTMRPAPYAMYAAEALQADYLGGFFATTYARKSIAETFTEPMTISDTDQLVLFLTSSSTTGAGLRLTSGSSSRSFDLLSTGGSSSQGGDRFAIYDATAAATRLVIESSGDVGIGTTTPSTRLHLVDGTLRVSATATGTTASASVDMADGQGRFTTRNAAGLFTTYMGASQVNGADGGQILIGDETGAAKGGFQMLGNNCSMFAQVKNFVMPNPDDASTELYYACVEGPEAAMYVRGTAQLMDGRAFVTLPRHFTAMAAVEGVTVQITPLSADCNGIAVVKKGTDGFEVRELMRGVSDAGFDWEVKAVRRGFEDYKVVRPAGLLQMPRATED